VNGDYASARGIEMTLIKRHSHGFSGELNYTFGNATGTRPTESRAPDAGNLRDQYKPRRAAAGVDRGTASPRRCGWGTSATGRRLRLHLRHGIPIHAAGARVAPAGPGAHQLGAAPEHVDPVLPGGEVLPLLGAEHDLYLQATNLLDAQNIGELNPSLWPYGGISPDSYQIYYTKPGEQAGRSSPRTATAMAARLVP